MATSRKRTKAEPAAKPAAAKAKSNAKAAASPKRLDGADYRPVHRRDLKSAPYNPRVLDAIAARGLRESIKATGGLIETPVWNKRTGNLVGGHQRLSQLDTLAGTDDYEVTVAVIDVDEKTEREINVRLNNDAIQGVYDLEKLDALIRDTDIGFDITAAGFDLVGIEDLYLSGGMDLPAFLTGADEDAESEVDGIADAIDGVLNEADAAKAAEKRNTPHRNTPEGIKERKREFAAQSAHEAEFLCFVTAVFTTNQAKFEFMAAIGEDPSCERIDGIRLAERCGIDLDPGDAEPLADLQPQTESDE